MGGELVLVNACLTVSPLLTGGQAHTHVQNAGELLQVKHPCITVGHGAEHVVSLFFKDLYTKVSFVLRIDVYVELCTVI